MKISFVNLLNKSESNGGKNVFRFVSLDFMKDWFETFYYIKN